MVREASAQDGLCPSLTPHPFIRGLPQEDRKEVTSCSWLPFSLCVPRKSVLGASKAWLLCPVPHPSGPLLQHSVQLMVCTAHGLESELPGHLKS